MVRRHGGMASAGYTWLPIVSNMRILSTVMIVGSGNGGLADLLITLFKCNVIGTDLESDMPRDAATLLNYVPIGIQDHNQRYYTQTDLCLSTDGDWYNLDTRCEFLRSVQTKTTLIIDATTEEQEGIPESVHESFMSPLIDTVYVRLDGSPYYIAEVYRQLSSFSTRLWYTSATTSSCEAILELSRTRSLHLHNCPQTSQVISVEPDSPCHDNIPKRFKDLIEAATSSVVSWDGETPEDLGNLIDGMTRSLLNKPESRQLLYKDRMGLIYAHLTMTLALHDSPVALLQDWIAEEQCETDLLTISMRESLLTHLLRYVPRLRSVFPQLY